jgi:hypothetical protein
MSQANPLIANAEAIARPGCLFWVGHPNDAALICFFNKSE